MVRAAIGFFIIAMVAYIFGIYNVAGLSMDIGRTLLFIFLVLALVSFLASVLTGKKPDQLL